MKKFIFAIFLTLLPGFGSAATIPLDTGTNWTEFRFDLGLGGGTWVETTPNPQPLSFSISLTGAAILQVTDAFRSGDRFEVFANGASLGLTSAPTSIGDLTGNDYDLALSDDRWSSGEWQLDAGNYIISGFARDVPEIRGRAALRVIDVAPIPLPGSLSLMLGAGAVLGVVRLRRRRSVARTAK